MEDVEPFLALAREAFGNEADAVNLWIGDERSLSAVHKDHYEVVNSKDGKYFYVFQVLVFAVGLFACSQTSASNALLLFLFFAASSWRNGNP